MWFTKQKTHLEKIVIFKQNRIDNWEHIINKNSIEIVGCSIKINDDVCERALNVLENCVGVEVTKEQIDSFYIKSKGFN